jgi:hypothetical protein
MSGKHRRLHADQPCRDGVTKKIWDTQTWLAPIEAQIAGIRLDKPTSDAILRSLSRVEQAPAAADERELERRRRQLGEAFAAGRTEERELITGMRRLKEEAAAGGRTRHGASVDPVSALAYVRNFTASWANARPQTRASLIKAVYAEIVVRGEEFVSVRLTDEAYAHGLAAALPEEVEVPVLPGRGRPPKNTALARPTGVGRAIATYDMPIEGRARHRPLDRRRRSGPRCGVREGGPSPSIIMSGTGELLRGERFRWAQTVR